MPDNRAGLGRAGVALLLLSAAMPAQAQTATNSINPFGRMSAAEIRPEVARTNAPKFAAAHDAPFMFGTIRFLDAPSSDSGSVVFGYDAPFRGHDLTVSGMYSRLSPDQGDDHNRWAVDGEMVL